MICLLVAFSDIDAELELELELELKSKEGRREVKRALSGATSIRVIHSPGGQNWKTSFHLWTLDTATGTATELDLLGSFGF